MVTTDTVFCPGTHSITDRGHRGVIVVAADQVTIDGNGLTLDGRTNSGLAILLQDRVDVTIRNFTIRGFYYAIWAEDCRGLVIEHNTLSENRGTDDTFLDINQPLTAAAGGGILFHQVTASTVRHNVATQQDVGVNLYWSRDNVISQNDLSHNTAWGIRLYASTGNTLDRNQAHHVNRCGNTGCDAAGILLTSGSDGNTVTNNNLTHSGDGFFIGNQFSQPSNSNLIAGNDGSYSPNNAFEATFSSGNVFRNNSANHSNYGFWLGFSRETTVENNSGMHNRTDGINWEHGQAGLITGNQIVGSGRHGVAFTLTPRHAEFPRSTASAQHTVTGNAVRDNGQSGIYLLHTTDTAITANTIAGNTINLCFEGRSGETRVTGNTILCASESGNACTYTVWNKMDDGLDVAAEQNWWGSDIEDDIATRIMDGRTFPGKGRVWYVPWLDRPPSSGNLQ